MKAWVKKIFATLLLSNMLILVKPISDTEVMLGTSTAALVTGAAVGVGTYFLAFNNQSNHDLRDLVSGLAAVGAAGLSAYFVQACLYRSTPSYAINKAQMLIDDVSSDLLISREFASDDDFMHYVRFMTEESNPLGCAARRLNQLQAKLTEAEILINKAYQAIADDSYYVEQQKACSQLKSELTKLCILIKAKILLVTAYIEHDKTTDTTRRIMDDRLLAKDNDDLIWYAAAHFGTSWPLVLTRDHFVKLTKELETARQGLDYIRKSLGGLNNQDRWASFLYFQEEHIVNLSKSIEVRMATIIQHPAYNFQVELKEIAHVQEQRRRHERELEAQRQAQRERQLQHEKEMEERQRRHEKEMLEEKNRKQREKDERKQKAKNQFLQQALANPNANIEVIGNI